MNKWVYIKSNRLIDAYAVYTVLSQANNHQYCMVRRVKYAKLFKSLSNNLKIGFYEPDNDSQLITILPTSNKNYKDIILSVAEKLGLDSYLSYNKYLPSTSKINCLSEKNIILMMSGIGQEPLNLCMIDIAISSFRMHGITTISAGTMSVPCIRGCKDYRLLITWENLPSIATDPSNSLIITDDPDYFDLCEMLGMSAIILKSENGISYANNQIINHPDELINLIIQQNF